MTQPTIRSPKPDELRQDAFAELRRAAERAGSVIRGVAHPDSDTLIALGVIDPDGRATIPEHPTIRVAIDPLQTPTNDALASLIRELVDAARAGGTTRVTAGVDPMDFAGVKRLEALGFRPAGSLPYFEFAGGHVEYITGYQDATGSTMDMVADLERQEAAR